MAMFSRTHPVEVQPLLVPILRDERDAALERRPRRAGAHLAAADEHTAAVRAAHAEDRLEQLRPARADQAGEPDHLAGVHRERDGLGRTGCDERLDLEHRLAEGDLALVVVVGQLAADHRRAEHLLRQPVARQLADVPAVAQDDRAVGELDDLGQPVRDQDRRGAVVAQPAQQPEESLDVAPRRGGSSTRRGSGSAGRWRAPCRPRRARGRPAFSERERRRGIDVDLDRSRSGRARSL